MIVVVETLSHSFQYLKKVNIGQPLPKSSFYYLIFFLLIYMKIVFSHHEFCNVLYIFGLYIKHTSSIGMLVCVQVHLCLQHHNCISVVCCLSATPG